MKIFALLFLWLVGCQQKMNPNGKVRPFESNAFFPNGSAAQLPVAGTVPRGRVLGDEALLHGTRGGVAVKDIPLPLTEPLLHHGRERYEIFCAPCHGSLGDGQGMVVRRGFLAPATFHSDRLRQAPAGYFFSVITHGYGAMFAFADRISESDRWAIVAYIRALQKSQHARYDELPPELRAKLDAQGGAR